jgi:WD40 repeat protein
MESLPRPDADQNARTGPSNEGEGPPRPEPRFWVREAGFSPDGKFLLTAYDFDGRQEDRHVFPKTASLWDVATGKECWSLKAGELNVIGFAFMPDGKEILITDYEGINVLDAGTGKLVRSFERNKRPIRCVAVSPDGKLALSGDMGNLTIGSDVVLWDVAGGKPIKVLQSAFNSGKVLFSNDGKLMLACGGTIEVWDVATCDLLVHLPLSDGWCGSVAFSPDGKLAVAVKRLKPTNVEGTLVFWEPTTGKVLNSIQENSAMELAFGLDGKGLLVRNYLKQRMALWDIAKGKELWTAKCEGNRVIAFSADGKLAFTAPGKRTAIAIWDGVAGEELRGWGLTARGPSFGIRPVAP